MNLVPLVAAIVLAIAWMLGWSFYFRLRGRRVIQLREIWLDRFEGTDEDRSRRHAVLVQRTAEVGRLLRGAGIPDGAIPFANPVGWGQIATGTAPLFDNWLVLTSDVPAAMGSAFQRAIGVYDDRARQSLNPLWWITLFLTAPAHLVRWLGGSGEGALTKVATLLWAIVSGVGVLLGLAASARGLLGI